MKPKTKVKIVVGLLGSALAGVGALTVDILQADYREANVARTLLKRAAEDHLADGTEIPIKSCSFLPTFDQPYLEVDSPSKPTIDPETGKKVVILEGWLRGSYDRMWVTTAMPAP